MVLRDVGDRLTGANLGAAGLCRLDVSDDTLLGDEEPALWLVYGAMVVWDVVSREPLDPERVDAPRREMVRRSAAHTTDSDHDRFVAFAHILLVFGTHGDVHISELFYRRRCGAGDTVRRGVGPAALRAWPRYGSDR